MLQVIINCGVAYFLSVWVPEQRPTQGREGARKIREKDEQKTLGRKTIKQTKPPHSTQWAELRHIMTMLIKRNHEGQQST